MKKKTGEGRKGEERKENGERRWKKSEGGKEKVERRRTT